MDSLIKKEKITIVDLLKYGEDINKRLKEITDETNQLLQTDRLSENLFVEIDDLDITILKSIGKDKSSIKRVSNNTENVLKKYTSAVQKIEKSHKEASKETDRILTSIEKLIKSRENIDLLMTAIKDQQVEYRDLIKHRFKERDELKKITLDKINSNEYSLNTCIILKKAIAMQIKLKRYTYRRLKTIHNDMLPLLKTVISLVKDIRQSQKTIKTIKSVDNAYGELFDFFNDESKKVAKEMEDLKDTTENNDFIKSKLNKLSDGMGNLESIQKRLKKESEDYFNKMKGIGVTE